MVKNLLHEGMSKHYVMKNPRIEVEFRSSEEATAKGGVFAVKAFAEECGLWERVRDEPALESRKDRSKGYDPVVYVATFLFGFASGGASMADFERLNDEPGLKRFLGIKRFPDETTLGQWMRGIGNEGAEALMRINREFIAWPKGNFSGATLLSAAIASVNNAPLWRWSATSSKATGSASSPKCSPTWICTTRHARASRPIRSSTPSARLRTTCCKRLN